MMATKFLCALFLLITSTCANAVIVDISYSGWVGIDYSDEGIWSKDMWQSEVTGKFWYDTELAPAPTFNDFPYSSDLHSYRSETNSWLNMVFFLDGKTVDISDSVDGYSDASKSIEEIYINDEPDYFRIHDQVMQGDILGDYILKSADIRLNSHSDIFQHSRLDQNFTWGTESCCSDMYLTVIESKNGKTLKSTMELAITQLVVTTREASVPEPSSFSLILLGLFALAFRRYKQNIENPNSLALR